MGTFVPIVNDFMSTNLLIGDRLKGERERLRLSQEAFAKAGGVGRKTQFNYESGERAPDALYLAKLAEIGVDVMYVVTGGRDATALTSDELELVALYRNAPLTVKAAAVGALKSGSANAVGISIGGRVEGQVVQGDLHQRDVTIAPKGRVKREK